MATIKSNYKNSIFSLYFKDLDLQDSFQVVAPMAYVECDQGEINAILADHAQICINYQNESSGSIEIGPHG